MRYFTPDGHPLVAASLALLLAGTAANALAATGPVGKGEAATIAKQAYPGQVVSEKLSQGTNGSSAYEVKIKGSQGTQTVIVDAQTGAVMSGGAAPDPSGGGMGGNAGGPKP